MSSIRWWASAARVLALRARRRSFVRCRLPRLQQRTGRPARPPRRRRRRRASLRFGRRAATLAAGARATRPFCSAAPPIPWRAAGCATLAHGRGRRRGAAAARPRPPPPPRPPRPLRQLGGGGARSELLGADDARASKARRTHGSGRTEGKARRRAAGAAGAGTGAGRRPAGGVGGGERGRGVELSRLYCSAFEMRATVCDGWRQSGGASAMCSVSSRRSQKLRDHPSFPCSSPATCGGKEAARVRGRRRRRRAGGARGRRAGRAAACMHLGEVRVVVGVHQHALALAAQRRPLGEAAVDHLDHQRAVDVLVLRLPQQRRHRAQLVPRQPALLDRAEEALVRRRVRHRELVDHKVVAVQLDHKGRRARRGPARRLNGIPREDQREVLLHFFGRAGGGQPFRRRRQPLGQRSRRLCGRRRLRRQRRHRRKRRWRAAEPSFKVNLGHELLCPLTRRRASRSSEQSEARHQIDGSLTTPRISSPRSTHVSRRDHAHAAFCRTRRSLLGHAPHCVT